MPGPIAPMRPPRGRLQSLNQPDSIPLSYKAAPPVKSAPKKAAEKDCCDDPDYPPREMLQTCASCGNLRGTESGIVAEITFGENSAGAAVVQGGFVGEDQRHANTMGGTMRGLGGMESREKTLWRGKDEIQKLGAALRLRQKVSDVAIGLYKLALNHQFVRGRRVRNVAAVCLYLADRRQPESQLLLMDLAEKIQVSVWTLGDTYKALLKKLFMQDPAQNSDSKAPDLSPVILKFCKKLEFGDDSYKVADDACNIVKRMNRDWMVAGRQPAGIIGAAIILAARMNNFRRTVREVVYIVKVADSTINQRLHEFKRTKSSALTVEQFRKYAPVLKDNMLPPAIYRRVEREAKKRRLAGLDDDEDEEEDVSEDAEEVVKPPSKRRKLVAKKRVRPSLDGAEDEDEEEEDEEEEELEVIAGPRSTRTRKLNKDTMPVTGAAETTTNGVAEPTANGTAETAEPENNFLMPDLYNPAQTSIDYIAAAAAPEEALDDYDFLPKKKARGRPSKKLPQIIIPDEDLEIEAEIEIEMINLVDKWENIFKEIAIDDSHPELKKVQGWADKISSAYTPKANLSLRAGEVEEEEFEDDEEVMNCVLNEEEVRNKERVWYTENEDWLRAEQQKILEKELDDARGQPKKVKQTRKRTQMGDGSVLGGKPAKTPQEAVRKMLDKNNQGRFSKHVHYDKLSLLLPPPAPGTPSASSAQGAASPADSGTGQSQTKELRIEEDSEGEILVEDNSAPPPVEDYDDEPIDDQHMYMDDLDEGFNYDDDF